MASPSPVVLSKRVALESGSGDAVIVSLNRPDVLNCFNAQVCQELSRIVSGLHKDTSVAAVIFTGEGTSFCAGADLSNPPNPLKQSSDLPHDLETNPVHQLSRLEVPIIGALQGYCITGGFELALACDIVVGDETTVFRDTHVKFNLAPCWGLSQKLQRRVGPGRAKLASLTAMPIPAKLAYEWGLLDDLVSSKRKSALDRALEIANHVAKNNDTMVRRYKQAIEEGGSIDLAKGLQRERQLGIAHYLEALGDGNTFENAKGFITDEQRPRRRMTSKL